MKQFAKRLRAVCLRGGIPLVGIPLVAASLVACTDSVKLSEDQATKNVASTAALAAKDVAEIRRGLPKGGPSLVDTLFADPAPILPTRARSALKKTREAVTDLQLAKSTFFLVADPSGLVLGSDQETDTLAGKNVLTALPGLSGGKTAYVETTGFLEEAKGVRNGADATWAAAFPVTGKDGAPKGLFVTGWSLRRFAEHLESQLKTDLRQEKGTDGKPSKMPLLYVFVLMGDKAYGAPVTPEVNQQTIEGMKLSGKLQGETPWHGKIEVTNREWGVAAQRVKDLCDTCAVAVLRSEI